jgi:hypothetical protein
MLLGETNIDGKHRALLQNINLLKLLLQNPEKIYFERAQSLLLSDTRYRMPVSGL